MKVLNRSLLVLVILILLLQAGLNQIRIPTKSTICCGNSPQLFYR
jgi:hypothetical protein